MGENKKPFFYIYETVEFPIQLSVTDALAGYDKVVVSITQKKARVDIDNPIVYEETGRLLIRLEQEDTAKFVPGTVDIQVNIYYKNKERDVTTKGKILVLDNLYKEVISS